MKRRWKRRMKKTSRLLSSEHEAAVKKSQKDFAWKQRKANPYRSEDTTSQRKIRLQLLVLFLSLAATAGLLLYHPFFHIRHIQTAGFQRIDQQEFTSAVEGIIGYNTFFILPKKNFFLFDSEELEDILLARFPAQAVHAETEFPGTLNIVIEEKISTLIYDNGEQYVYVGGDGHVIEPLRQVREDEWLIETEMVTSTDEFGQEVRREEVVFEEHRPAIQSLLSEFGHYPVVYDTRGQNTDPQSVVLKEETPDHIFDWFQFLQQRTDISFRYMILDSELGDATIKTGEGWELRVSLNDSIERQVTELELALRDAIDRNRIQYIDLRYPGRVYWQ